MPPKKIYCSIGPVPKSQKLGSMKECAEKKQIRYYGIKKIDPKLLESISRGSKGKETRDKLAIKMIGLRGRVGRITKDIASEKDKTKKEKLVLDLAKAKSEFAEVSAKFSKADKERRSRGGSKRRSKKRSNRVSRRSGKKSRGGSRKRSSKKGSKKRSRRSRKR